MTERKEPGQLAFEAYRSRIETLKTMQWAECGEGRKKDWARVEAAIYEDAAKVARTCFWSQVGGGRVVSRQASPDEVEAAIRAKIGGSHG